MDAVVKIGGSLSTNPNVLRALCIALGSLSPRYEVVVVPGGGKFADTVRMMDQTYTLHGETAHKMAILGMNQYGLLLSNLIPNSKTVETVPEATETLRKRKTAIFLPSRLMAAKEEFECSWDMTSDSIAAFISSHFCARKLILVKDVDGVFASDPNKNPGAQLIATIRTLELIEMNRETCVDRFLPKILDRIKQDCFIANGHYPDRIEKILAEESAIGTKILHQRHSIVG